jgi:threonylcarbamoyladenosine tRNA methylthiotransferase MtaB
MKRTISFKTLGCRLNQYETDALASQFDKANYTIVGFGEDADVCIVNTCTVTNKSDQKSRNIIHQAEKRKDTLVVVTGCMANHYQEQLEAEEQISFVVPNEQKSSIFSIVDAHVKGEMVPFDAAARDIFSYEVASKSFHTRCMVKIQDGCDNFCTFCIIPMVRGRAVSRPVYDILENVRKSIDLGYKEIVLTGVNIGRYQFESCNFEMLVEKILEMPGDFRVRISSIEPDGFGEPFFDLIGHDKMCPHLHLCLQSGSDKILLQMRRMYSTKKYLDIIEKIKAAYPVFNFTTDVIVGFPGETDADFAATCDMIQRVGFSHVHTFPYSVRDNTRAARMPGQIPSKIKNQRSATVRAMVEDHRLQYMQSFVGRTQTVLTETIRGKMGKGYGEHYLPVQIAGSDLATNTFYKTLITGVTEGKTPFLKGVVEGNV